MPDYQQTLMEINSKLTELNVKIQNIYPTMDLKLCNIDDKTKSNTQRIEDLEEHNKWLSRGLIGAMLVQVVSYIMI